MAGAIAYKLKSAFVPLRKPDKLPGETYKVSYTLEYGSTEMHIHKDALENHKNLNLVDLGKRFQHSNNYLSQKSVDMPENALPKDTPPPLPGYQNNPEYDEKEVADMDVVVIPEHEPREHVHQAQLLLRRSRRSWPSRPTRRTGTWRRDIVISWGIWLV